MEIEIRRRHKLKDKTIGALSINGIIICDTIEKADAMLESDMPLDFLAAQKQNTGCCVPTGIYSVEKNWDSDYRNSHPSIIGIPGWGDVLIQAAREMVPSRGIVVGFYDAESDRIKDSITAMAAVRRVLQKAWKRHEDVEIEIRRDYDNDETD